MGYLAAGLAVGPFTPGFVADIALAEQLGEIGIVILMFGVGLHFSVRDLLAVRSIAIPGAIVQSVLTTLLSIGAALLFGWSVGAGLVLGLALSVASTVMLVRALVERDALDTPNGRIAVGWLVVEDMFSVLVLLRFVAVPLGGCAAGPTLRMRRCWTPCCTRGQPARLRPAARRPGRGARGDRGHRLR